MVADVLIALKNADNMIQQVMQVLDTNKDGKIQYEGTFMSSFTVTLYSNRGAIIWKGKHQTDAA